MERNESQNGHSFNVSRGDRRDHRAGMGIEHRVWAEQAADRVFPCCSGHRYRHDGANRDTTSDRDGDASSACDGYPSGNCYAYGYAIAYGYATANATANHSSQLGVSPTPRSHGV